MDQESRLQRLEEQIARQENEIRSLRTLVHALRHQVSSVLPAEASDRDELPFGQPGLPEFAQATDGDAGVAVHGLSEEREAALWAAADLAQHAGAQGDSDSAADDANAEHRRQPAKEPIDWEHRLGQVWLPRVFLLVLLLGVIWGFRAAVTLGLLSEPVRCGLGVLAAAAFLWLGERQIRPQRTALGQVLLGGSISLLILTTFAAHMLYGLIGAGAALVAHVAILAIGVYLSLRHRSEALAVLASLGGYLAPFLIKSTAPNTAFFISYEVVLSLVFVWIALRRQHRVLFVASLTLFHLAVLGFAAGVNGLDRETMAVGLYAHHLLLLVSMLLNRGHARNTSYITLFTSGMLTILWSYVLLWPENRQLYEAGLLVMTGLYAILAVIQRREPQRWPVSASVAAFALMIWLMNVLQGTNESIALLLEGALTLGLALQLRARFQLFTGGLIYLLGLLATFQWPLVKVFSEQTLAWLLLLVTFAALLWLLDRRVVSEEGQKEGQKDGEEGGGWMVLRFGALAWAFLLLVFLTELTDVLARPLSRDGQYMAISFTWALYAIAAIVYGTLRGVRMARLIGVGLLFVTLFKLVLIDLPIVSVLVRAVLFIGVGAAGVAISRMFYMNKKS